MVLADLVHLLNCRDYQDYLDSHIRDKDICYLRSAKCCRTLISLGYRSTVEVYSQEQFEKLSTQVKESWQNIKKSYVRFSSYLVSFDTVLRELAQRELPNQQKILSTIIFIKYRNKQGFEITGFVDYEQSLREAHMGMKDALDWLAIFTSRAKLRARITDLSYYNWHSSRVFHNNSDNYVVTHDANEGLLFRHRGDHKKISPNISNPSYKQNCKYTMAFSSTYGHVLFLDHVIRKKI